MNFVGRAEIIERIQSRIAMGQMSLCVIYGPHRSGKSYVASQLVRRHKAIYLAGRMANESVHVADINRALEARFVPVNAQDTFEPVESLQQAFMRLFESSVKTPQTVVIDDYPSLVEAVPQFPIHLRDLLDTYKDTSRLNIILMANGLEQLDGRIIGDRSLIGPFVSEYLEVKPFSLVDMKSLGLHYAKDDLRTVFAVTGGLPAYVQYFDNGESIDTNIINLFFSVTGALFEETQYILHRDMKNITGANAILTGLASLERPYYVELLQESKIKSGTFTSRLNDLMSMGLVGRIQASSRGNAKYADYHFTNSMFHFWYRYVYKYWGDIVRGYGADVYYNHVKPQLNDFVQAACIAI